MGEAVEANWTSEEDKAVHHEKQPSRNQASLGSAAGRLLLSSRILTSRIEITYSSNLQTQELNDLLEKSRNEVK